MQGRGPAGSGPLGQGPDYPECVLEERVQAPGRKEYSQGKTREATPRAQVQAGPFLPKSTAQLTHDCVMSSQPASHFRLSSSGQFHGSTDFPFVVCISSSSTFWPVAIPNIVGFCLHMKAGQKYLWVTHLWGSLNTYRTGPVGEGLKLPIASLELSLSPFWDPRRNRRATSTTHHYLGFGFSSFPDSLTLSRLLPGIVSQINAPHSSPCSGSAFWDTQQNKETHLRNQRTRMSKVLLWSLTPMAKFCQINQSLLGGRMEAAAYRKSNRQWSSSSAC